MKELNMLKNYVVNIRNVNCERLGVFVKYLNDVNHKNHTKKDTQIISQMNKEQFLMKGKEKIFKNEENYEKNGKGGRKLKVFGKSLTFNIPTTFEMNENNMKDIEEDLISEMVELYKSKGYQMNERELYSVIHLQDNSHIHMIIPYLDRGGNTLRFVKPKQFTNELKLIWTKLVEKHLGVSKEQYKPLSNEKQQNNKVLEWLIDLKVSLLELIQEEENVKNIKYYKNQIIVIDRIMKDNSYQEQEKIKTLNQNMEKINNYKKKEIIKTFPKF